MFWFSLALVAVIAAPVAIAPETGKAALDAMLGFLTGKFGWLYLWFAVAVAGLLIWLAFSRYGKIKFGDRDDKPEFSTLSWISMIFTAGIGGGIMYWGVIEWGYYYNDPPMQAEPHSVEAASWASSYPLFHWGITAWALFCLPALALAYVYHVRKQRTLRLSDACRGVIGDRADGWLGKLIDVLFIFGIVGAAGTSLGLEVPLVSDSISRITGAAGGTTLDIIVIAVWTLLFGTSVALGLQRGLKRLANFNVWLAGALGLFILILGPTVFIVENFTHSVGMMLSNVMRMSFYTDPVGGSGFDEEWTVFYWGWWIAYAPFVGLFAAKISRGRTVRGMIGAMCVGGSLGCWLAFSLLGNTSMFYEIADIVPVADILSNQGPTAAIMDTMSNLPLGSLALLAFVLLLVVFLATTLDSSAYTMAVTASRELPRDADPARWHRVFWGVVLAAVSVVLMYAGGLEALQTLSIVTAFPLIFVLVIVVLSLRRWLVNDKYRPESVLAEAEAPPESDSTTQTECTSAATAGEQELVTPTTAPDS